MKLFRCLLFEVRKHISKNIFSNLNECWNENVSLLVTTVWSSKNSICSSLTLHWTRVYRLNWIYFDSHKNVHYKFVQFLEIQFITCGTFTVCETQLNCINSFRFWCALSTNVPFTRDGRFQRRIVVFLLFTFKPTENYYLSERTITCPGE